MIFTTSEFRFVKLEYPWIFSCSISTILHPQRQMLPANVVKAFQHREDHFYRQEHSHILPSGLNTRYHFLSAARCYVLTESVQATSDRVYWNYRKLSSGRQASYFAFFSMTTESDTLKIGISSINSQFFIRNLKVLEKKSSNSSIVLESSPLKGILYDVFLYTPAFGRILTEQRPWQKGDLEHSFSPALKSILANFGHAHVQLFLVLSVKTWGCGNSLQFAPLCTLKKCTSQMSSICSCLCWLERCICTDGTLLIFP